AINPPARQSGFQFFNASHDYSPPLWFAATFLFGYSTAVDTACLFVPANCSGCKTTDLLPSFYLMLSIWGGPAASQRPAIAHSRS
ncbi:hypothetical protein NKJ52_31370, partial [Mesorhizobium australicum]|uniref:hypothetical protein n=1 Tax=Mesorhizobium australicum TaxID=536018 RepID=UPI0033388DAD